MDQQSRTTSWLAPAKINLALHVTGRRPDGYHLLETIAVFSDFGDRVFVRASAEDEFAVEGPYASAVPTGPANIVVAARDALRAALGNTHTVAIRLEKNLPVASGVGGGSSDAAAALKALALLWGRGAGEAELREIGIKLGADLPMCLRGRALVASGIGEVISPVENVPRLPMVLVNPGCPVSTPDVFRALTRRDNPGLPALPERPSFETLVDWLGRTRNDLQQASISIAPAIGDAIAALQGAGAAFSRMSGSGATCFGLFAEPRQAEEAAQHIQADHPGWFVTATSAG